MGLFRKAALFLIILCFSTAIAQDSICSAIVQQALGTVQDDCSAIGRNQACYGFVSLAATAREGVQNFIFEHDGDLANIADLANLRLAALDPATNTWGVALMKLQANLPDTLPGQNVTFVLFGDVEVQNAVEPNTGQATQAVTARFNSNIRSGPAENYRIIGTLGAGDTATATGRNQDSSWLRIQLPNSDTLGWIANTAITSEGDTSLLSIVDGTVAEVTYKPMQAFYFQSGPTQTACTEAPQNGILIQTPSGGGKIDLRANDVDIQLGSTVFLQAQPGGVLTVSVLEGQAIITADGKTVVVPAGSQASVPIDENLHVAGRPDNPQPYDLLLVSPLPIILLPETITVAPPATADQISAANLPTFSVPGLGVTGLIGDVSSLSTLSLSDFCPLIDRALAQANTSRSDFIDMMNRSASLTTGMTQQQLAKVAEMLASCP